MAAYQSPKLLVGVRVPGGMPNMKKEKFPKIVKGNHLTVITHKDGRVELQWDDEALLKEVREAIASVTKASPAKRGRKKKT